MASRKRKPKLGHAVQAWLSFGRVQDGIAHRRGILISTPLFLVGLILAGVYPHHAFPMAIAYCIGGVWLSPDLDLIQSIPTKQWGPLAPIWKPYSSRVPHRGISHTPILGSLSRLLLLGTYAIGAAIVALAFDSTLGTYLLDLTKWLQQGENLAWVFRIFIAIEASALWHLFCDGLLI